MIAAVCGTFDPVTKGHVDLIERASKLFDHLVVFVSPNSEKNDMFHADQRLAWLQDAVSHLENVTCQIQQGLSVEACKRVHAHVLVRGVRNASDCEYEQNMAFMNHIIDDEIETILLYAKPEYMNVSSSNVKELLKYHLDISRFVPACVQRDLGCE